MTTWVPLPFDLPAELSDQAAAELVECLYEIADCLERRYFDQIQRYYEPEEEEDPRQQRLFEDDPNDPWVFDEPLF